MLAVGPPMSLTTPLNCGSSVIPLSSLLFIVAELVAFTAWLQGEEDAMEAEE